jgi:hypothetical protein
MCCCRMDDLQSPGGCWFGVHWSRLTGNITAGALSGPARPDYCRYLTMTACTCVRHHFWLLLVA